MQLGIVEYLYAPQTSSAFLDQHRNCTCDDGTKCASILLGGLNGAAARIQRQDLH